MGPSSTLDDTQLVRAAKQGSREAAGELFRRHWPGAWRAAYAMTRRRELAEDIVQDAFERAFRGLERFDAERPFAPWLHRIVVNRALTLIQSEPPSALAGDAVLERAEAPAALEGAEGLLVAVALLAPERRAPIVLRYGLGYSLAEVAELLELPIGTVQSRIHRALAELRPHYEEAHGHRA